MILTPSYVGRLGYIRGNLQQNTHKFIPHYTMSQKGGLPTHDCQQCQGAMVNKKLRCCCHTARHVCTPMLCCQALNSILTYFCHLMNSMRGITSGYQVHIWYGKTRMAGLQSGEGRVMINSVVWAQHINVTDTQPLFVTERQPRHHIKCHPMHWR